MIKNITIKPSAGIMFVQDADLAYIKPLIVTKEGGLVNWSRTITGNRICKYVDSEGRFYFTDAFNGEQEVSIKYKATSIAT